MYLKNRHKVQIIFIFSKRNTKKIIIAHNIYNNSSLRGIFSVTLQPLLALALIREARCYD